MSSLTNNNNIAQSMNGLVSINSNDITSDTITANTITTTDLFATNLTLTNSTFQNLTANLSTTLNTLTNITGTLNIGTSVLGVATAYFGIFTIGSLGSSLSQLTTYGQNWFYNNLYFYNTSGLKRSIFYISTIAMDDINNSGSQAVQANLARNGGLIVSDNTQMTFRQSLTEKIKFTATTTDFTNNIINNAISTSYNILLSAVNKLNITATTTDFTNDIINNTVATSHNILVGANPKITILAGTTTYANTTHNVTGTTTSLNTNSGTVNLGIGGTSTTNVNIMTGATPTGIFTIGRPMTISYLPSAISGNTQKGFQAVITGTTLVNLGTTLTNAGTVVTLPAGVWSVNAVLVLTAFQTGNQQTSISLSTVTTSIDNKRINVFHSNLAVSGIIYINVSSIFSVSTSTPIYLTGLSSATNTNSGITGYYTRLA